MHNLPRGGTAWLQGSTAPTIVVALGRPAPRRLPELTATEARQLATTLCALADQLSPD